MKIILRSINHHNFNFILNEVAEIQTQRCISQDDAIDIVCSKYPTIVPEFREWVRIAFLHQEHSPIEQFLLNTQYDSDPTQFFNELYLVFQGLSRADRPELTFYKEILPGLYDTLKTYDPSKPTREFRRKLLGSYHVQLGRYNEDTSYKDLPRSVTLNNGKQFPSDEQVKGKSYAAVFEDYFVTERGTKLSPSIIKYVVQNWNQAGLPSLIEQMTNRYFIVEKHSKNLLYHLKFERSQQAIFNFNIHYANNFPYLKRGETYQYPFQAFKNCSSRYMRTLQLNNRFDIQDLHTKRKDYAVQYTHSFLAVQDPLLFYHMLTTYYLTPHFGAPPIAAIEVFGERLSQWQSYIAEAMSYILKCENLIREGKFSLLRDFQLERGAQNDKLRQFCLLSVLVRLLAERDFKLGTIEGPAGVIYVLSQAKIINSLDDEFLSSLAAYSKIVAEHCLKYRKPSAPLLRDIFLYYPELYSKEKLSKSNLTEGYTPEFFMELLLCAKNTALDFFVDMIPDNVTLQEQLSFMPDRCQLLFAKLSGEQNLKLQNTQLGFAISGASISTFKFACEYFDAALLTKEGRAQLCHAPLLDYYLNLFEQLKHMPDGSTATPENKAELADKRHQAQIRYERLELLYSESDTEALYHEGGVSLKPDALANIQKNLHGIDVLGQAAALFTRILCGNEQLEFSKEDTQFIQYLKYVPLYQLLEFNMRLHLLQQQKCGIAPKWLTDALTNAIKSQTDFVWSSVVKWQLNWSLLVDFTLYRSANEMNAKAVADDPIFKIVENETDLGLEKYFQHVFQSLPLLERYLSVLRSRVATRRITLPTTHFASMLNWAQSRDPQNANSNLYYNAVLNLHQCEPTAAYWVFDPQEKATVISTSMPITHVLKLLLICIQDRDANGNLIHYHPLYVQLQNLFNHYEVDIATKIENCDDRSLLTPQEACYLIRWCEVHPTMVSTALRIQVARFCALFPSHRFLLKESGCNVAELLWSFYAELSNNRGTPAEVFAFFKLVVTEPAFIAIKQEFYVNTGLVERLFKYCKESLSDLEGNVLTAVYVLADVDPDLRKAILQQRVEQIKQIIYNHHDQFTSWSCLVPDLISLPQEFPVSVVSEKLKIHVEQVNPVELSFIVTRFYKSNEFRNTLNSARIIPAMIELKDKAVMTLPLCDLVSRPEMIHLRRGLLEYTFKTDITQPLTKLIAVVLQQETRVTQNAFFRKNPSLQTIPEIITACGKQLIETQVNPAAEMVQQVAALGFHRSPPKVVVDEETEPVNDAAHLSVISNNRN